MAIVDSSEETTISDSEGTDSADKPPHGVKTTTINGISNQLNITHLKPAKINGTIPLPPPDTSAYDKQPGHTRGDLKMLSFSSSPVVDRTALSTSGDDFADSPSSSLPPSGAPSRSGSRAPSMSGGTSGGKLGGGVPTLHANGMNDKTVTPSSYSSVTSPTSPSSMTPTHARSGKPPSVHSDTGGSKFTLKDLLATAPKVTRKASQRSTGSRSSRVSDSDAGSTDGGKARSKSDSAVSLTQKYGVCQKVAIGKGATSVVRLAHKWDRSEGEEKLYAVKEFRKRRKNESEKEYVKKLTAEFCISSTLHHPNIVETVDLVQDESQHWCEVMEFCPGGDLYAAIKKGGMSPSEVECCFKQILRGVEYLHNQGVAHRDIKPENLFFDTKGNLKIGDYGASTVYRLPWEATIHMSTGLCGSEPYIAPEQFLGKPYDARLVDIWACGIVYYCLHFQELPWRAAQPATDPLYQAYATACANTTPAVSSCPPTINNLSPRACRSLIRKMLEPNPGLRSTIDEVMAHSWVQSIEMCLGSERPTHVHVSARAMGLAQLGSLHSERG